MCRLRNIALRVWQTDRQTDGQTDGRTDRQTTDKVIPMCRYASQATQKKVVAKRSSISYYGRGDAQCIIHSFELLCKRNLWKGGDHHGIYSDTAQVQSRLVRWTGGGGVESTTFLSRVKRATRWVLFVCMCMEIVFDLSHTGNKYFCPDKFCRPTPPRD